MEVYIPLLAGLFGAIIGAAGSVITVLVQARTADRRDRIRMVIDLAAEDRRQLLELATKTGRPIKMLPPVAHLHYYIGLVKLLESGGVSANSLEKLHAENAEVVRKIYEMDSAAREAGIA
jgi:hypothetical protein